MLEHPPKAQYSTKITKLFQHTEIVKILREVNTRYDYWDKIKYLPLPKNMSSIEFWSVVKLSRQLNYVWFSFTKYKFCLYQTDNMSRILHLLDQNTGGYLGTNSFIPETNKDYYLFSSHMEEAIASSKMEGAVTTRKLAKQMLRKQQTPKTLSERMIVNNYDTINFLKTVTNQPLTPELICAIHKMIVKGTLDSNSSEGCVRVNNKIVVVNGVNGEIVHTPPKYNEIPELLEELCIFCNSNDPHVFIHPIVKGVILHFLIAYIHPFVDGNGRTARALFYWYLMKQGYWLTEYLSISRIIQRSKVKYETAFIHTEMDDNDLSYFVNYNLAVMDKSFEALKAYIQRKIDQNNILMPIPGVNERQSMLIQIFSEKPQTIFTVKEVQNRFGVSYVTARNDLFGLVDLGLVISVPANQVRMNYIRSKDFSKTLEALQR